MAASEAAVTAVHKQMGCKPYDGVWNAFNVPICDRHGEDPWTDRGCPVAVAAADAAVDADRASIQAETLREAASEFARDRINWQYGGGANTGARAAQSWLRARADRIEGKP